MTLRRAERVALAALAAVAATAWLQYPVLPTYDSLAAMNWGREIVHGGVPDFASYQAPTQHPLWVAASAALALGGDAGARAMTAITVGSLVALVAGTYVLGRTVFGPLTGALASIVLLTRLNFGFYAAFGFVDIPFVALIVWAAALEARRLRRGGPVWVLLVLAGLLRPEGWAYAVAYGVWVGLPLGWLPRVRLAAFVVIAPVLWMLADLAVTGDPLFSWTYTAGEAELLGRQRGPREIPRALAAALDELLKLPVLLAALAGLVLAVRERGATALRVPLALLALGATTFAVVLLGGVSGQVPRYAAVAAVAFMLFAGDFVTRLLRVPSRLPARAAWAAAALLAVAGGAWSVTHLHPRSITSELRFRHRVESDLTAVLHMTAVRRGERCGPIAVPTHKLVPATLWAAGAARGWVVARTDPDAAARRPGVVLISLGTRLLGHPGYGSFAPRNPDPALVTQVPPAGFERRGRSTFFSIYTRC